MPYSCPIGVFGSGVGGGRGGAQTLPAGSPGPHATDIGYKQ